MHGASSELELMQPSYTSVGVGITPVSQNASLVLTQNGIWLGHR
jgi:hypothetical protein